MLFYCSCVAMGNFTGAGMAGLVRERLGVEGCEGIHEETSVDLD